MKSLTSKLVAGVLAATLMAPAAAMANELVLPSLDYRTGPYAPGGIPYANGYADYFAMLNARDGGINGVKANVVPCETGYNTKKGVECYEKTKNVGSGALAYLPLSTGITYQLIPKVTEDKIPSGDHWIWPHLGSERPSVRVCLQPTCHLLGRCYGCS